MACVNWGWDLGGNPSAWPFGSNLIVPGGWVGACWCQAGSGSTLSSIMQVDPRRVCRLCGLGSGPGVRGAACGCWSRWRTSSAALAPARWRFGPVVAAGACGRVMEVRHLRFRCSCGLVSGSGCGGQWLLFGHAAQIPAYRVPAVLPVSGVLGVVLHLRHGHEGLSGQLRGLHEPLGLG